MLGRCMSMMTMALKRRVICFSTIDKVPKIDEADKKVSYSINLDNVKGTKQNDGGKYLIMYTCKVCSNKSARTFSKDAYHNGVVIIRCEHCKNYHLIADNLRWFNDYKMNIEDIMNLEGMKVHKIMNEDCIELLKGDCNK